MSIAMTPAPAPTVLGQHVVNDLRRLVITGRIAPGTRLVEAKLSERYGTSRGPIRDALRVLESEDLVESRRNGVYVLGLSERDLEELYGLRGLIESEVLRLSAVGDGADWTPVDDALARMRRAVDVGDVDALGEADLDFHSAFYRIAGQRRLEAVWNRYRPTFGVLLSLSNAEGKVPLQRTLLDHETLADAVRAGDEERITRTFAAHNNESLRRMRGYVASDEEETAAEVAS